MSDAVRKQLGEIPELYALLGLYLEPGSLPPDPDARRATASHGRLPLVLDVVDLLDTRLKLQADDETGERDLELDKRAGSRRLGILPTLGLWVSMVIAELADQGQDVIGCCPPHNHTVTGECSWLARHLTEILDLHSDFADDVAWMHRDLQKAVGERPVTGVKMRCLKEGCGWDVQEMDGGAWYRCTGCGKAWPRLELHRMMPQSLPELANRLGKNVRTLQRRVAAAKLKPVGVNDDGDRLYRKFEVESLFEAS